MAPSYVFAVSLMLQGIFVEEVSGSGDEYRLVTNLLNKYDQNVRPVQYTNQTMNVTMGVKLVQILDLNERDQVLRASYWLTVRWTDYGLKWEPDKYGGIKSIRLSVTRIWRPDITLYNDVTVLDQNTEKKYPAVISYDSTVSWYTPVIFQSSCPLDVTYYPWDKQSCSLEFGSWTYGGFSLDINNLSDSGNMEQFTGDGEWTFDAFPVRKKVEVYGSEPFPTLVFTAHLSRKPLYYIINLAVPSVFVTFLGVLVFLLPPDSGEKVSMAVTILLATTFFLTLLSEYMPNQSDVIPLLGKYFLAVLLLQVLSTTFTVVILYLHHRPQGSPVAPPLVQKVVLQWLATAVCIKTCCQKKDCNKGEQKVHPTCDKMKESWLVNGILDHPAQTPRSDWVMVAVVLDRVFLIIFLVIIIAVTMAIFLDHP